MKAKVKTKKATARIKKADPKDVRIKELEDRLATAESAFAVEQAQNETATKEVNRWMDRVARAEAETKQEREKRSEVESEIRELRYEVERAQRDAEEYKKAVRFFRQINRLKDTLLTASAPVEGLSRIYLEAFEQIKAMDRELSEFDARYAYL